MKKMFYCVTSKFYDDGRVNASMISKEYKEKPESTFQSLPRMDVYHDWFDSPEDAEASLAEARAEGKGAGK
ncbi:MAG: hypothetical protein LBF74_05660 [Treponema sp.]|jgi:hypothetical protein|nr:hypothetical protein [Treponema sp.]